MSSGGAVREASHAGSWYKADPSSLAADLDRFLGDVPSTLDGHSSLPIPGARVIIAPHAGYTYSGPCAGYSYKLLDLSPSTKRIFVLGPSHTYYLSGLATTTFSSYATPLGALRVDTHTLTSLRTAFSAAGLKLADMPPRNDVKEHSLEMHLPILARRLAQVFGDSPDEKQKWPPIVPLLVGSGSASDEAAHGRVLAPYLRDENTVFIVSSDFCHWGEHFDYRPHCRAEDIQKVVQGEKTSLPEVGDKESKGLGHPIYESVKMVDEVCMERLQMGGHKGFYEVVQRTGNTVCGRHPIGVVMAALEVVRGEEGEDGGEVGDGERRKKGVFRVVQYRRSSLVEKSWESSVSYVAAYAVL